MKKLSAILLVALALTSCGGDDDDSSSSTSDAPTTDAAAEDFCEVWPDVNDDEVLADEPSDDELREARDELARVRAAAPDEIEDEVTQMVDAIEGIVDDLEAGEELSEDSFGELFGLAFSVGPPIEAWMVEHCPDYEPEDAFADDGGESTGPLGIPQGDIDDIRFAAVANDQGASTSSFGDEYEWTIYFDGDEAAAIAACEQIAEALAAHPDASGTLRLTIATADETILSENEVITAGDAGVCEEGRD